MHTFFYFEFLPEHLHAVLYVGHLVVVVQPGGGGGANVVDAGLALSVAVVAAALVLLQESR